MSLNESTVEDAALARFGELNYAVEHRPSSNRPELAAEAFQLPAPDFRVGEKRTSVVLFGHQDIENMDRNDRIRACHQHCCLRYVMNESMTNQSLRDRFKLPESKVATVSQIIAATVEAGKIKLADPSQTSTRYRNYVPFWA